MRDCTHNDHMANMPTAEFRVGGILHVDDPAGDEDAQPRQEKVLHLDSWKATLWRGEDTVSLERTSQLISTVSL